MTDRNTYRPNYPAHIAAKSPTGLEWTCLNGHALFTNHIGACTQCGETRRRMRYRRNETMAAVSALFAPLKTGGRR